MDKVLRVARNRGNARVWIERGNLLRAGIQNGARFVFRVEGSAIVLDFDPGSFGEDRPRKVAGTPARPIVDICNRAVSAFMGDATHYRASFAPGRVTITREPCPECAGDGHPAGGPECPACGA